MKKIYIRTIVLKIAEACEVMDLIDTPYATNHLVYQK